MAVTMRSFARAVPRWMTRENSASINWMLSGAIWLVVGTSMGLILALEFVLPEMLRGVPYLVFSRLRQAHVNTVIFAFLSLSMVGLWFYVVPQLTGRRLWSEFLANVSLLIWNGSLLVGIAGLLLGHTQSREYAELIYGADVGILVALILNAIVIYVTTAHRVQPTLYVSMWYILASAVIFPIIWFVGNVMWNPPTGAVTGVNDVIYNWFLGHNVLGMWVTLGGVALIYYIVPKVTDVPIYSHVVGLIGFWTILLFYNGLGGHHIEWVPVAPFVKNYAIASSIGMLIPTVAVLVNIWFTVRGQWNKVVMNIPLIFVFTGFVAYILVSFQGTHQALRMFNLLSHFTHYVPAHAHLGLLFFAASVFMGAMYYVVPRICRCQLYSRLIAWVQYSLLVVGFFFFFVGFTLTGLEQGTAWYYVGINVYPNLVAMRPFLGLRAAGGALLLANFILFYFNILMTWVQHRPQPRPQIPVNTVPPEPVPEE